MPQYDAMPQTGDVNPLSGEPTLMKMDALVEGIINRDPNCLEWTGDNIDGKWGTRRAVALPPETERKCTRCGAKKVVAEFRILRWNRPDGRLHVRHSSWCRECESEANATRNKVSRRKPKHPQRKRVYN